MKETDYINAYRMALAQFNLNQLRNENEMLKTTAGMTAPMPAYNFLPVSRLENIGPSVKCSDCFEPVNQPEDGEYKRGFIDGWVKCTDYFIKHELNKEDDIYG